MTETNYHAAEELLRELADALTTPGGRECLACFVVRMLREFDCPGTLRFVQRYRDLRAPRATALERRLTRSGGTCDCEVIFTVFLPHPRFWQPVHPGSCPHDLEVGADRKASPDDATHYTNGDATDEVVGLNPPDAPPNCAGVRRGTTQPCEHWVRRRRGLW